MKLKRCDFCCEIGLHPKAHLIPKFFFPNPKIELSFIISSRGDCHPKRCRTGWYDRNLWCLKCEAESKVLDDHATKILLPTLNQLSRVLNHRGIYKLKGADSQKLHLFFLSVLWRISSSNLTEVKNFKLHNLQDTLCEVLINPDEELLAQFPYSLQQIKDLEKRYLHVLPPSYLNIDGIDFVRIKIGAYIVNIKLSEGAIPDDLKPFLNHHQNPDVVVIRDRNESSLNFGEYLQAVQRTQQKRGFKIK